MLNELLLKMRQKYLQQLNLAVQQGCQTIIANPNVHKIILIGSYNQDYVDLFSDLEFVIIMDSK